MTMSASPDQHAPPVRIIAIGASAGGVHELLALLPQLPLIPNCCLLIVLHLNPTFRSLLPQILRRTARWKVQEAQEGETVRTGIAYIAAPDFHLVITADKLHLTSTAPVQLQRPSVDVLFASVAKGHRIGAIAVLLSGAGRDGSDGLRLMKISGASTIVQDPAEAKFPSMPEHGIETGCADFVIPMHSIIARISSLCAER
ncbi:MAG TPA: chemotaxis protein CheB [Terriglobales bacterium]|nr:chemotaxis protein CheB [Terriglobales bacterium]